jgi:hypothetical protein
LEIIATRRQGSTPGTAPGVKTAALDIEDRAFDAQLKALDPDLVIHCAGPFQGQDYRVALGALRSGAHYIDLADSREFVAGFISAVESAAKAAGRLAVTGASTLPALSSAVVDSLQPAFHRLRGIDIVIAPGQRAPRGMATLRAVLGYAGKGFPWWQGGNWRVAHGWQELKRETFSFGTRLAAACDVPDLSLMPDRYPTVQTVTFRAALEVAVQHISLWILAALRRAGAPIPIDRWVPTLNRIAESLNRFGSGTGGMKVGVEGVDALGNSSRCEWELVARDNHGPEVPCMAAVLLAMKLACQEPAAGAKVCMGMVSLAEFETEFARWSISTTQREAAA